MSEWPRICDGGSCQRRSVPAVDHFYHNTLGHLYLCKNHSVIDGVRLKAKGFNWEQLPESELAKPTSEREHS